MPQTLLRIRDKGGQRRCLFAAAAVAEHIAQAAFFAYAVSDGENDGQIAAVENVIQDSALRAAQDEQKDKDPQAAVAAEVSETTVH